MGRQLEAPPSVEKASASASDPASHKRLHSELNQQLQNVINQIILDSGGEDEPASPRGRGPPGDDREGPRREREPAVPCPPAIGAATVAPPPRKADPPASANRKQRGQGAPVLDMAKEIRAAPKPAKVPQDRKVKPEVKPAGALSGKQQVQMQLTALSYD